MPFDYEKGMTEKPDMTGGATLKFDPTGIRGLENYQSGDKVTARVTFTMGDVDENGTVEATVDRIVADPMGAAKKVGREMMRNRPPSMVGTAMESDVE